MLYESLESRRLMTGVTAVQVGQTLIIGGTPAADQIIVLKSSPADNAQAGYYDAGGNVVLLENDIDGDGANDGFAVDKVVVLAGGGDDVLSVTLDGADGVVLGGDGANRIEVFASNDTGLTDATSVYVGTGDGDDTVVVDAFGNTAVWVSTGSGVDSGGVRAINGARVYADSGNDNDGSNGLGWVLDAIGADAAGTGSRVEFNGGNGDDWVSASAGGGGVVVVDGGNGADHLSIGTVAVDGTVILNGGNGRDTFEIININDGGRVTVNGGNGKDALTVLIEPDGTLCVNQL